MKVMSFSKEELLRGLSIPSKRYPIKVKLINDAVQILFTIEEEEAELKGYHKSPGESRIGIARCAFYFLLTHLLDTQNINRELQVRVCPVPGAAPLPADWESVHDPASGKEYYWNTETQQTTWKRPGGEDGNMERLIKIYIEMGFIESMPMYSRDGNLNPEGDPIPGSAINLRNSVGGLISTLEKQCLNMDP